MSPEERQFAQTHLVYLQVQAERHTQELLRRALKRLDDLVALAEDRNEILEGEAPRPPPASRAGDEDDVSLPEPDEGEPVVEDDGVFVGVSP